MPPGCADVHGRYLLLLATYCRILPDSSVHCITLKPEATDQRYHANTPSKPMTPDASRDTIFLRCGLALHQSCIGGTIIGGARERLADFMHAEVLAKADQAGDAGRWLLIATKLHTLDACVRANLLPRCFRHANKDLPLIPSKTHFFLFQGIFSRHIEHPVCSLETFSFPPCTQLSQASYWRGIQIRSSAPRL